jgi:sec-independent protein translocase protein TatB
VVVGLLPNHDIYGLISLSTSFPATSQRIESVEFLGIGPLELVFIILIALVVIGPKDISRLARSAGRFLNRMYRSEAWKTLTQASRDLQNLPNRLAREAELEDLSQVRKTLEETGRSLTQEIKAADDGLKAWTTPIPPAASPSGNPPANKSGAGASPAPDQPSTTPGNSPAMSTPSLPAPDTSTREEDIRPVG